MSHTARRPGLAALLALLVPGLGHLYCGRPLLFIIFLALINPWTCASALELSAAITGKGWHNWVVLMLFPCAWLAQILDAVHIARGKRRAAKVMEDRSQRAARAKDKPAKRRAPIEAKARRRAAPPKKGQNGR